MSEKLHELKPADEQTLAVDPFTGREKGAQPAPEAPEPDMGERLVGLLAHCEHQAAHGAPLSPHILNELRAIKAWFDGQNATGDNT